MLKEERTWGVKWGRIRGRKFLVQGFGQLYKELSGVTGRFPGFRCACPFCIFNVQLLHKLLSYSSRLTFPNRTGQYLFVWNQGG